MKREQFVALPASVALGILWDTFPGLEAKLANAEPPKLARPPKYDSAIYRKDGVTYASEYDAEGLRYWRDEKLKPIADPEKAAKYGEKNVKQSKALDFWIAWRLVEPHAPWTGERNRETVTAKAPSGKPEVYPRDGARGGTDAPQASTSTPSFDEDDSDIPFIFCVTDEPEERWWKRPASSAIP